MIINLFKQIIQFFPLLQIIIHIDKYQIQQNMFFKIQNKINQIKQSEAIDSFQISAQQSSIQSNIQKIKSIKYPNFQQINQKIVYEHRTWNQSKKLLTFQNIMQLDIGIKGYQIYISINIFLPIFRFTCSAYIIKNGFPFHVQCHQSILLLSRLFSNFNSLLKIQSFKICGMSGSIRFGFESIITQGHLKNFLSNADQLIQYICIAVFRLSQIIKSTSIRILTIINEIPQNIEKIIRIKQVDYRRLYNQIDNISNEIKSMIIISSFDYGFSLNNKIKPQSQRPQDQKQKIEEKNKLYQQRNNIFRQLLNDFNNKKEQQSNLQKILSFHNIKLTNDILDKNKFQSPQEQQQLIKILRQPISQPRTDSDYIYNKIQIKNFNQIDWSEISIDNIYQKGNVQFQYSSRIYTQNKYKKKVLVKKSNDEIMKNQQDILKQILSPFRSAYISQHYHYQSILLTYFYDNNSLKVYQKKHKKTYSLLTKLYFLSQISSALRFLKDLKITHLKIKPSNICISKKMIIKLTDFQLSYHPNLKQLDKRFKIQKTKYTAPQITESTKKFQSSADVYSFGILIYDIVFNLDQEIQNKIDIKEKLDNYGPKQINEFIYKLYLLCTNKEAKERPKLEWISLIFAKLIAYLQKLI